MRNRFAVVIVALGLLTACGSASSQPSCSDPGALDFLRSQLDRPFEGAKSLLTAIQIPVPDGIYYELNGMAAVDTNGLQAAWSFAQGGGRRGLAPTPSLKELRPVGR